MLTLVTGSAGHLGEALVRTLRARGLAVRGLDRRPSAFTDIAGDIADPAVAERAMAGVGAVLHTATLHKPHVAIRTRQDFVDTNITGTLALLEAAVRAGVAAFVFTSTTSTFGGALVPPAGAPAAWITEAVAPVPKNIYGVTKVAAEDLCALAWRNQRLPCVVLRTSRFFPETDDDPAAAAAYADGNLKANEYLHRRVEVDDVVEAHLLAIDRAPAVGFARYIISATTPFRSDDAAELRRDAPAVLARCVPEWAATYERMGWRMAPTLDRIYDNARARSELGWRPRTDFAAVLARVQETGDVRSELARTVGEKDYA